MQQARGPRHSTAAATVAGPNQKTKNRPNGTRNELSKKQSAADAVSLASTTDFHLLRKLWHALGGLALAWGHGFYATWTQGVIFLAVLFGFFLIFEVGRQHSAALNAIGVKLMGPLLRKHEVKVRALLKVSFKGGRGERLASCIKLLLSLP